MGMFPISVVLFCHILHPPSFFYRVMKNIRRETLFGVWALSECVQKLFEMDDSIEETLVKSRELYLALLIINKRCVKIKNGEYDQICETLSTIKKALNSADIGFENMLDFLSEKSDTITAQTKTNIIKLI